MAKAFCRMALLAAGAIVGSASTSRETHAAFVFSFQQVGPNVVGSGSGSFNLAGLTYLGPGSNVNLMWPAIGVMGVTGPFDVYAGASGPGSFGPGGSAGFAGIPMIGTGDPFHLQSTGGFLGLPSGYIPNAPVSNGLTILGQTFASLGMTPGTYVWTWGSDATVDSFTLQIGPSAVPEPASALLLGASLLGLVAWRRQQQG
jgi:hypothetical protein